MPPEFALTEEKLDDERHVVAVRGESDLFTAPELKAAQLPEATPVVWDDAEVDWAAFDLVVVRSTWDYTGRRDAFVAWAQSVGRRLVNPPEVIRWNTDKRYLADLEEVGLPIVPTH